MVLCKCFFKNYTYFTLPCRGLGVVGLALYLVDWPTIVLQCFDTVGWIIWPVKIVPNMTCNVFGGMLNPTLLLPSQIQRLFRISLIRLLFRKAHNVSSDNLLWGTGIHQVAALVKYRWLHKRWLFRWHMQLSVVRIVLSWVVIYSTLLQPNNSKFFYQVFAVSDDNDDDYDPMFILCAVYH